MTVTRIVTIFVHVPGARHTDKCRCWIISLNSEDVMFIFQGRLRQVKSPAHSHQDGSELGFRLRVSLAAVRCAVMEVAESIVEGQWFSIGRTLELGLVG